MSDRYKTIGEQTYSDYFYQDMPVALCKSRILFDNESQQVITQVQLRNLSDKRIDTVYLALLFYDVAGALLTEVPEHIMAMLEAASGQTFGEKAPVYTSDIRTSRVDVLVRKVVFQDGTTWENVDKSKGYEVAPSHPVTIMPALKDKFYQEAFRYHIHTDCHYEETKDYIRCSCGMLNMPAATKCIACGAKFQDIRNCFSEGYLQEQLYQEADNTALIKNIDSLSKAVSFYERIMEYRDSAEKLQDCKRQIETLQAEQAERRRQKALQEEAEERERIHEQQELERQKKRKALIFKIAAAVTLVCIAVGVLAIKVIIPSSRYRSAVALYQNGRYEDALAVFSDIKDFKDSSDYIIDCKYEIACDFYEQGNYRTARNVFIETAYRKKDVIKYLQDCQRNIPITLLASGDITGALKTDGTVVATGNNEYGQCDVTVWTDITNIFNSWNYTVGLKSDGTVVAVGNNEDGRRDVTAWTDITNIFISGNYTIGLKSDRTVVTVGGNGYIQRDVTAWTDIIAISPDNLKLHAVGLRADGTVVAVGDNRYGKCDVTAWTDITAISTGGNHTVGLRSDGTVVATGNNEEGQCDVTAWTDIIAIYTGGNHTIGLRSDGTVVATGNNKYNVT